MENQLLFEILTGGLLGILGQGIRLIVGISKGNPDTETVKKQLFISLFIGFIAGTLALVIKAPKPDEMQLTNKELILTIIAAGYAGADFIEGIMNAIKSKIRVEDGK